MLAFDYHILIWRWTFPKVNLVFATVCHQTYSTLLFYVCKCRLHFCTQNHRLPYQFPVMTSGSCHLKHQPAVCCHLCLTKTHNIDLWHFFEDIVLKLDYQHVYMIRRRRVFVMNSDWRCRCEVSSRELAPFPHSWFPHDKLIPQTNFISCSSI